MLSRSGGNYSGGISARSRPPPDVTDSSEEEDDDDYEAPGGSGVSSRGRVRRPNPRLME